METIFFPRNDYPSNVEVCTHRLGKAMTYTEQTDGQNGCDSPTGYYNLYMNMVRARNLRVGCFIGLSNSISDPLGVLKEDYDNGNVWFDAYSLAPNIQTKIANLEPISQEEWNEAYTTYIYPNFYNFFKKKPVALSYSYGNQTFKDYITQFLGGRNSAYNGDSDYGSGYGTPNDKQYSFSRFCSKASTMRFFSEAVSNNFDFEGQLTTLSIKIDETLQNHGWFNQFGHWHDWWQKYDGAYVGYAEDYLDMLATKQSQSGNQIYFAGYGEAVAYLVYRQIITKAVMYSPNAHPNTQLVIRLETDNTLSIDTDLLQVPISIKFSTVGTPLENHNIKCDTRNLISLGNNEYIVEIPFSRFPVAIIEKVGL